MALNADVERAPRGRDGDGRPRAAFYCVADEGYFLGAVALVNSLRLVGHTEPIFICDCGLSDFQREQLAPQATLVRAPRGAPPWLTKAIAPVRHPAGVMVLIDTDMIVTRSFAELIATAAAGAVVAVEHGTDRFCEEWADLLGFPEVRRRPYVSSSLIALSGEFGERVLRLMGELADRVDFEQTYWRRNVEGYPLLYADQDLFNAILAAEPGPDRVHVLARRLEALMPFEGLRVLDEDALRCAYEDGVEPYAMHHYLPIKPWLEPTMPGTYTQLLKRLLRGDKLAVRVPRRDLPWFLRGGARASARNLYESALLPRVRGIRERWAGG